MKYFCFLIVTLCVVISGRPAYALECPVQMPKVYVKNTAAKLEKVERVSAGGLAKLHGGAFRPGQPSVLGLGGGGYELNLDIEFETLNSGSLSCVGVKALRGTFHIEPKILVASNYAKGSCEYNAIMKHEMEHVNILKRFQSIYSAKYQLLLQKIAADYRRYHVTSGVNSKFQEQQVEQAIAAQVERFVRESKPVLTKRQLELDSPEEYTRVAGECTDW